MHEEIKRKAQKVEKIFSFYFNSAQKRFFMYLQEKSGKDLGIQGN